MHDGEPVEVPYREHVPPSDTACIFWLKNRRPELWNDRVLINGRMQHDHRAVHLHARLDGMGLDLSRYSADQLRAIEDFAGVLGAEPEPENQE